MRTAFLSVVVVVSALAPPLGAEDPPPRLFQSDMSLMAGITAEDTMAGMAMPRWSFMDLGVFRFGYNRQGGPSGDTAVESTNWNMAMAQRDLGGGRLTLMLMTRSSQPPSPRPAHRTSSRPARAFTAGRSSTASTRTTSS